MLIHATVDETLIALGTRRDACGCPAALAVARKLPPGTRVAAFADRIEIGGKPHPIPGWLTAAIRAYDDDRPFPECEFAVDTSVEYVHPRHREPLAECDLWGEVA